MRIKWQDMRHLVAVVELNYNEESNCFRCSLLLVDCQWFVRPNRKCDLFDGRRLSRRVITACVLYQNSTMFTEHSTPCFDLPQKELGDNITVRERASITNR